MDKEYRYVYGDSADNQGIIVEREVKKSNTKDKHKSLLNNCVNDDEAILRKREIEEIKSRED